MKDIFSLVTLTAGAFCFAIFLTTVSNGAPSQPRLNHSATTAPRAPASWCHLHGALLAGGQDRLDVLAHLGDV